MTKSPKLVRGIFHAVVTRDGEALRRDGEPFVSYNVLPEEHYQPNDEGHLLEVLFVDGQWMLAREADLELF